MALGGAFAFLAQLLPLVPDVVKGVTAAVEAWDVGTGMLRNMVDENRDPTPAEWDEINGRLGRIRSDLHTDDPDEMGHYPDVEG